MQRVQKCGPALQNSNASGCFEAHRSLVMRRRLTVTAIGLTLLSTVARAWSPYDREAEAAAMIG
jgi:hypothetical protein